MKDYFMRRKIFIFFLLHSVILFFLFGVYIVWKNIFLLPSHHPDLFMIISIVFVFLIHFLDVKTSHEKIDYGIYKKWRFLITFFILIIWVVVDKLFSLCSIPLLFILGIISLINAHIVNRLKPIYALVFGGWILLLWSFQVLAVK